MAMIDEEAASAFSWYYTYADAVQIVDVEVLAAEPGELVERRQDRTGEDVPGRRGERVRRAREEK